MKDEYRNDQLIKWEKMLKDLFKGDIPLKREWHEPIEIIRVLNFIGKNVADNHTFMPRSGGVDIEGCSLSNEKDCIEINFGYNTVVKPKRLTFQYFENADTEWAYFYLELNDLKKSEPYEDSESIMEEVVEVEPGEYLDRGMWEYYRDELPDDARIVVRYTSGNMVTFSKGSLYNMNSGTYDARHSKMGRDKFNKYIEEVVHRINEEGVKGGK